MDLYGYRFGVEWDSCQRATRPFGSSVGRPTQSLPHFVRDFRQHWEDHCSKRKRLQLFRPAKNDTQKVSLGITIGLIQSGELQSQTYLEEIELLGQEIHYRVEAIQHSNHLPRVELVANAGEAYYVRKEHLSKSES